MNRLTKLLLSGLLAFGATAGPAAADWPQWAGPGRDFQVADSGLADTWPDEGPREIWRRALGDGYSGIAVDGGLLVTLYRDGARDAVAALDAGTGATLWTHAWDAPAAEFMDTEFGPGPHSTPLIVGDRVFAVGGTGHLVALERSSGRPLWSRELWDDLGGTPLPRGYAASPIAHDDLLILPVGGPDRALVAFQQSDGAVRWSRLDHGAAYASPIRVEGPGGVEIVALLDKVVVGVDPADGALQWSFPLSDYRYVNVASPVFYPDDALLFLVSAEGGRVLNLEPAGDRAGPQELWVGEVIGSQVGNVVRFGSHVYGTRGSSASKYVTGVDIRTGELAWRDRAVGDCNLLRVGDEALILAGDGTLHRARPSPRGLGLVESAKILDGRSWTAPALAGSRLYARNRTEIVALDLAAASVEAPEAP